MAEQSLTEDDDELTIVEVDEIPAEPPPSKAETPSAEEEDRDDHDEDDHDEDDDDGEDARLAESEDDPDGDTETNASRKKRLKRRQAQKKAREAAQRELFLLRTQNEQLAKRLQAVEGNVLSQNESAIDSRINEARSEVQQAELIMARAIEAGNGDDVAAALRLRDEAKARQAQLEIVKHQVTQVKNQPPAPDPRVSSLAQEWMQANPWYDPQGGNEDSAITNAIDARLVQEGYNPSSVEYWQELTNRLRARLAQPAPRKRAESEDREPSTSKKKAPPMGSTREHAPPSTKKEVYVTPERKQAMIDAGIWDDPVKRTQMLKAYQAYDRNSAR